MIRLILASLLILTLPAYGQERGEGNGELAAWDEPVVYSVVIGGPPAWPLEVTATFPHTPETLTSSDWSSFAFTQGWSALVGRAVVVEDGVARELARGADGAWAPGVPRSAEPLTIRYSIELGAVFEAYEELPKTTAPWTDGRSLAVPGFSVFMHAAEQGPFTIEFSTPPGFRVDAGWRSDPGDRRFRGSSLERLMQNTFVIGHHEAVDVNVGGMRIRAVPLGRHRDGLGLLAPIVEAHAHRFQSLFAYPADQSYLVVLIDDAWDTGESFPDSFAMAYSTPIQRHNQAAWGKTIAHELFHYWLGGRLHAEDWASSQWFSEGMTDYIATRAMVDAGFMTRDEFFDEMQKHVSFYALFKQGIVYEEVSLVDSGSRKSTHNAAVYDGGWLVALCMDIIIRERTANTATVETMVRRLWDLHSDPAGGDAYTNEDVIAVAEGLGGAEIRTVFDRHVAGLEPLPLEAFFARAGLRLVTDAQLAWVRDLPDASAQARAVRDGIIGRSGTTQGASLRSRIESALREHVSESTPGAAVVVTLNNEIIVEYALGMADLEHGVPLTADSVFHIASDAKRFTAAAVCRLAERGQLQLQDPVALHLPELDQLESPITIEHLLCHSSGLKDQWSLLAMAGWHPEDIVTHAQVIQLLSRQRSTNFVPGETQMYSNSGYTLLAEIVARVSGMTFGEFVAREFFEPAGMSRTRVRASVGEVVPGRAESYRMNEAGEYVRRPVQYEVAGATSLLSTPRDLARWIEAVHADPGVLTPFELETMLQPRSLPNGERMTYMFGLHEHGLHGLTAIGHGGADGGFRSYVLRVPEARLGVVVLSNTPAVEPNGLAHQIAEWTLNMTPPVEADSDADGPEPPELEPLVGTYADSVGGEVTVRQWFDGLKLWEGGPAPASFSWAQEDGAFVDATGRRLQFDREGCRIVSSDGAWEGERGADPSRDALREYEGDYYSPELGVIYTVSVDDQRLVVDSARGTRIALTAGGRDFFDGDAWYCSQARFQRDADGKVRGVLVSSGRAFDVPFERQD